MRPTPIEDETLAAWGNDAQRVVLGPPGGFDPLDGDVRPVETLTEIVAVDRGDGDAPVAMRVYRARFVLEPDDLERLAAGKPIWMSLWSMVVPFDLTVES